MTGPTPGPWVVRNGNLVRVAPRGSVSPICGVHRRGKHTHGVDDIETLANARLIAAAPDHALVAWGLAHGLIRWEPTELCGFGLRHSTKLDDSGVPKLTPALRDDLMRAKAEGRDA